MYTKETIAKIMRSRLLLQKKLNVKISLSQGEIETYGNELNCYVASRVFDALERNFPRHIALLLAEEDYIMEDLPIKSITRRKQIGRIRGRIIGQGGKTLRIINELSGCYLELNGTIVSIIGHIDKIKDGINSLKSLICGSKQANVYSYLERQRRKPFVDNLGLKIKLSNKNA